jgi:DNA repair protein SbcC/Rad50
MRIISVQLKNIKSHREKELFFSPGINVLSGANGSGKSTIFEAIGYALFGVDARDFVSRADRFVTFGATRGEISVTFEPAQGELYRVTRTVGGGGKWLLAKDNGEGFEIEEHANSQETESRIAGLLGLSKARSLADQFKLVIGPFQNDFLGPFVIRQPTKRQDAFDEILGIDAWRKTFDGTKTLAGAIASKMETLQAEVAGKQEQIAVLPAKEQELSLLQAASKSKQEQLGLRLADQERLTAQLAELDARKERIDAAQSAAQQLEEKVGAGKEYVANQQLLVVQSKDAAAVLAATTAGKQGYDAAEEKLKQLRAQEQQKLALERKLAELEKEQSSLQSRREVESRELADLDATIATDSKSLAQEEQALASALAEVRQMESEASASLSEKSRLALQFRELPMHRVENATPYLFTALDRMMAIDSQCKERLQAIQGRESLLHKAGELPALQSELEKVQRDRSERVGKKQSLVEGQEKMEAGDCPFFHEPCKNLEIGSGQEIFTSRIDDLDSQIAALDARATELTAQVVAAQSAGRELAVVEQVAVELEKAKKERLLLEGDLCRNLAEIAPSVLIDSAAGWLQTTGLSGSLLEELRGVALVHSDPPDDLRARIMKWSDGWRGVIVSLEKHLELSLKEAEAPVRAAAVRLAELSTKGEALEAKRGDLVQRRERMLQREKVIETLKGKLAELQSATAAQSEALDAYAGISEGIGAATAEMERFQADREAYIAHLKAAEELAKRQELLEKYQARLTERERELSEKRAELQDLLVQYHVQQHEEARRERETVMSAVATLKAELVGQAEGISRLQGEIAALTAVADEIALKLAAVEKLKEQGTLVKFLRNQVFKNVSAQLSERFREEISSRADRIYRSIAESDEELFWGENYQIVLRDMTPDGMRERTDDQLSGGQMMSAVVALRLALLQTIGARIAFFDEPTSNLDQERRENLAKAFRSIDIGQEEVTEHWYDQLFLVSHDVSFTEITDQTIQLD